MVLLKHCLTESGLLQKTRLAKHARRSELDSDWSTRDASRAQKTLTHDVKLFHVARSVQQMTFRSHFTTFKFSCFLPKKIDSFTGTDNFFLFSPIQFLFTFFFVLFSEVKCTPKQTFCFNLKFSLHVSRKRMNKRFLGQKKQKTCAFVNCQCPQTYQSSCRPRITQEKISCRYLKKLSNLTPHNCAPKLSSRSFVQCAKYVREIPARISLPRSADATMTSQPDYACSMEYSSAHFSRSPRYFVMQANGKILGKQDKRIIGKIQ